MTEQINKSYGKQKWNRSSKGKRFGQFKKANIESRLGYGKPNKVAPPYPKDNKAHRASTCLGKTYAIDVIKKTICLGLQGIPN